MDHSGSHPGAHRQQAAAAGPALSPVPPLPHPGPSRAIKVSNQPFVESYQMVRSPSSGKRHRVLANLPNASREWLAYKKLRYGHGEANRRGIPAVFETGLIKLYAPALPPAGGTVAATAAGGAAGGGALPSAPAAAGGGSTADPTTAAAKDMLYQYMVMQLLGK